MLVALAGRNFLRHGHRFAVVLAALSIGFASVLVLLGVTGGMQDTLRTKAALYFGGDISVFSFAPDRTIGSQEVVAQALRAMESVASLTRRTEYLGGDGTVFFAGHSVRQRKLVGVDWSIEGENFRSLDLTEGSVPHPDDPRALLISVATADRLGARVGDDVTLVLNTLGGQRNSLELVVSGIYQDNSFFGYASYLNLDTLNSALGHAPEAITSMGAMLKAGYNAEVEGERLRAALAPVLATYPTIKTRDEQTYAFEQNGAGAQVAVMTLGANLAQIDDILYSLVVVAAGSTMAFLAIVMIGVGNTYRMVVFERTRELGTMRALGLGRARLVALIAAEAGWLALAGALIGGILGAGVLLGLMVPRWGGGALGGLFLKNGHLVPNLGGGGALAALMVLVLSSLLGALGPALRAARLRPVDALRSGE